MTVNRLDLNPIIFAGGAVVEDLVLIVASLDTQA